MKNIFIALLTTTFISSCNLESNFNIAENLFQSNLHIYVETEAYESTRCAARDDIGKISFSYENQDKATAFSVTSDFQTTSLSYSIADNSFKGIRINDLSNELVVVYPEVSSMLYNNGRLLLPIPEQDGTLQSIANHAVQWGFTNIKECDSVYYGQILMQQKMAICRFDFESNGQPIKNIISAEFTASKGAFYANRYLNIASGAFEEGDESKRLIIKNSKGINDYFYVAFFPSSFALHIELTDIDGNRFDADIDQNRYLEGRINYFMVECKEQSTSGTAICNDYIEVCGIQWAKGNLIYDAMLLGNHNCREHYYISENQWFVPEMDNSISFSLSHFNWGVCNDNALSNSLYAKFNGNLSCGLYADAGCNQQTNFTNAQFGDLAYWATNGNWRLPTQDEMYRLFSEASYSRGYYLTIEGEKVYGYLFWNTVGKRETSLKVRRLTDEELSEKLFLPCAGIRESKSSLLSFMNSRGYYWHGSFGSDSNQLMLSTNGLVWRSTGASYGRTIRAVKCTIPKPEPVEKEYIEILGTKWARGNLMYGTYGGTTNGFQNNWSLSENQWRFIDAGTGFGNRSSQQDPSCVYHFNWGVCGINATSLSLYANCYMDISGMMFEDRTCICPTNNFSLAQYGDVAFWASNGKYRLPTSNEMYRLFSEASYSRGCYVASDGSRTFGFLFKNPVGGKRVIETQMQTYTDNDLLNYLFLPSAGNRQAKSSVILRVGYNGYYWHSFRDSEMCHLRFGPQSVIWQNTSPAYGRAIRPVLNE